MISKKDNNGNLSSEATVVEKILKQKNRNNIIKQAEYSLKGWYDRITKILKSEGVILLMGKNERGSNAEKLIKNSYFSNNEIKIDLCNSNNYKEKNSLYNLLINNYNYKIFFVPHAAAFSYNPNYKDDWLNSLDRVCINSKLYEKFSDYFNSI